MFFIIMERREGPLPCVHLCLAKLHLMCLFTYHIGWGFVACLMQIAAMSDILSCKQMIFQKYGNG